MTLEFRDLSGEFIKQWPNVEYAEHGIPQSGDTVILHWGDYNEVAERYRVLKREFDGTNMRKVVVYVEKEMTDGAEEGQ